MLACSGQHGGGGGGVEHKKTTIKKSSVFFSLLCGNEIPGLLNNCCPDVIQYCIPASHWGCIAKTTHFQRLIYSKASSLHIQYTYVILCTPQRQTHTRPLLFTNDNLLSGNDYKCSWKIGVVTKGLKQAFPQFSCRLHLFMQISAL